MLSRLLKSPFQRTVLFVTASLAISSPALVAGFINDDYYFDNPLVQIDSPCDYYTFASRCDGAKLGNWWASESFDIRFFRPLSSLMLHVDFELMGGHPTWAHLHSAVWFVLFLIGAFKLIDDILPKKSAVWATAIFAFGIYHAMTLTWVAARHAALGSTFSVWSALYYFRYRLDRRPGSLVAALILYVSALLSSEIALTLAAFAASIELAYSREAVGKRVQAVAPILVITAGYLLYYQLAGYGATGSGIYISPFEKPVPYAVELVPKLIGISGSFLMGIPAIVGNLPGAGPVPLAAGIAGGVALVTAGWIGRPFERDRRRIRWLTIMAVLGALPAAAGLPDGRGAALSGLGIAAIAGMVLSRLLSMRREGDKRRRVLFAASVLVFGTLILSPLNRIGLAVLLRVGADMQTAAGKADLGCEEGADVFLVNGGFMSAIYDPVIIAAHQGVFFRSWYLLSEPMHTIRLTRTGANQITLRSDSAGLVHNLMYRLLRSDDDPLETGDIIEREEMRVRVVNTTAGRPTEIEVTVPHMTDAERTCWITSDGSRLRPYSLPGVGQTDDIVFAPPG